MSTKIKYKTTPLFPIGTRVVVTHIPTDETRNGMSGIVVALWVRGNIFDGDGEVYGVQHDDTVDGGHSLDGACECGHGWWYRADELEEISDCDLSDITFDVGSLL